MTFDEAEKKLLAISAGKHFSLSYERTTFSRGPGEPRPQEAKCWIYVDPRISAEGPTWADAFRSLEIRLNKPPIDPEEAPQEEVRDAGTTDSK